MEERTQSTTTSQSLITKEHVKKVLLLDKGKDAQLESWKVLKFTGPGGSLATKVSSVHVDYFTKGCKQGVVYIVKVNSLHRGPDIYEEMINVNFTKELKFYLELLPELNLVLQESGLKPLRFPKCFHGSIEKHKEQIYFEDLRQKGFQLFDRTNGMDASHSYLVISELAKLHAASLILEAKYRIPLEVKYEFLLKDLLTLSVHSRDVILKVFEGNLAHSMNLLQKMGVYEKAVTWTRRMKPHLLRIFTTELKNNKYDVVCHGDCWNSNLLFRYSDTGVPIDVMLLDLQISRKAAPATDLNFFLYTSLMAHIRTPNMGNFLSFYYNSFKGIMNSVGLRIPFSEEELVLEFRLRHKFVGIYSMMSIPFLLLTPDEAPIVARMGNNNQELLRYMDAKVISLNANPMLKLRFFSMFDQFVAIDFLE